MFKKILERMFYYFLNILLFTSYIKPSILNSEIIKSNNQINNIIDRPLVSDFFEKLTSKEDMEQHVYLLVSTASHIYCIKMPNSFSDPEHYYQNEGSEILQDFEIIYSEEKQFIWITDALYSKSENLIYANVYDSTLSSSNIITLKYDSYKNIWVKKVLFKDQNNCLGNILFKFISLFNLSTDYNSSDFFSCMYSAYILSICSAV